MYGLLMKKEYILDILNQRTFFDARLYDTDIRGKIGLIESTTYKLYGYVDLYDVHQITYEDYVKWHITDDYNLDVVNEKLSKDYMINRTAYAYDFNDIELLHIPKMINPVKLNHIWVSFDENEANGGYIQQSLF
jgi:hypothetical protein